MTSYVRILTGKSQLQSLCDRAKMASYWRLSRKQLSWICGRICRQMCAPHWQLVEEIFEEGYDLLWMQYRTLELSHLKCFVGTRWATPCCYSQWTIHAVSTLHTEPYKHSVCSRFEERSLTGESLNILLHELPHSACLINRESAGLWQLINIHNCSSVFIDSCRDVVSCYM